MSKLSTLWNIILHASVYNSVYNNYRVGKTFINSTTIFYVKITQGKMYLTQGKHREFHLGWNVATLWQSRLCEATHVEGAEFVQSKYYRKTTTLYCWLQEANDSYSF